MIRLEEFVEIREVSLEEARALTPSQRVELAIQLTEAARARARAKIAARHPAYSPTEVNYALVRMLYGDDLFRRVWPCAPLLMP